jgi:ketosteroid isomerase-like protein
LVGLLSMPGLDIKLVSNTKIISEAGDLVVDLGTYEMNFQDAKGKPMHDVGKYTTVLRRENGEWKIAVDTWNSDAPMPGM